MFPTRFCRACAVTLVTALCGGLAFGQAPIPSEQVPIDVDSGLVENTGSDVELVYSTVVEVPDALWLRLNFEEVQLSGSIQAGDESYLLITSLKDDAVQYLNGLHVRQWKNTSAYFNGDAVLVELFAHPGTGPNRISMREVTVGVYGTDTQTICGPTDDRELSDDPRAGRLLPIGCTAWIITDCNHCMLSAGHCSSPTSANTLEFNVPLSDQFGNIQHPGPEDQYAVDDSSIQFVSGGVGNDWGYWGVFPNTNTGLTPFEAQGDAFTVVEPPAVSGQNIRITGYGTTSSPVPPQWNQVQKTHTGPYSSLSGTTVQYRTDTTGGNSGSPVIDETTGFAIGIHTHGGCTSGGGANSGTGANHSGLQAALASPQGVCAASALGFNYPGGLPDVVDPDGGTTVRVEMLEQNGVAPEPGTGMLHYDDGSGYVAVAMDEVSDNVYDAVFPSLPCDSEVHYYFSAESTDGQRFYDPGGCTEPSGNDYRAAVADSIDVIAEDAFETDNGWTVGSDDDDATTGIWNRVDPEGTAAQPEDDNTPDGTDCWVTDGDAGSGLGDFDVDGGQTTLTSPVFDVSGAPEARVSYWRWYSNDQGAAPNTDIFVIDVSNDGGASWTNVETVGPDGPGTSGGWIFHEFRLADFVTPTANVQMRFIASDEGSGSIVEAALDDFQISVVNCGPPCDADIDGSGAVDIEDLSILLGNFGTASGADFEDGDLDGDGDVDLEDLSILLGEFGLTCN